MTMKKDTKPEKAEKKEEKKKKKAFDYYEMFLSQIAFTKEVVKLLSALIDDYKDIDKKIQKIHEVEHEGDKVYHAIQSELYTAFITPIEREDILELANKIDDLTDSVEDIAIRFNVFNIKKMRKEAADFIKIISACCTQIELALGEFRTFKKSKSISSYIVEINRLEGEGDALYQKALYNLFTTEQSAIEIIKWRETFDIMENCCDTCEDVANTLGAVIMKNS